MDCSTCEQRIQSTPSQLDGVVRSSAEHGSGDVAVVLDPTRASAAAVRDVIEKVGFEIT